ncbi:sensor domain-containing diguanylate cyclase [Enterovibrio makurazakiensis]|uniref:diguanylate cyclase n=1 Tax=Enterovibrio gelatinilyticus TaxID=2899819 RepID=A0ABT5R168_9GAMM|nr:sensor domain-containing diguanylate cyclase [Enterovibrio sp. ZSDZ42]MDD1793905.1 sensor domain-containing diguanylate cyclase [Enterovibrio sp. ZSDZ42]
MTHMLLHQPAAGILFITLLCAAFFSSNAMSAFDDRTLTVVNSHSWKPFAFVENGKPKGLLVDYWRVYGEVNNVPIQFVLSDWNQSLEHMTEPGRKVHAGLLYSSSRDHYLDYTLPLFEISSSLYVLNDSDELKIKGILPGMEVGVVRGGYEEEYIKYHYPEASVISFNNNAKLIESALNGEITRMVLDTQVATYYLSQDPDLHRFVPIESLYTNMIYAAVSEGDQALHDEIISGIGKMPEVEVARIEQKWLNTKQVFTIPNWVLPSVLTVFAIVALSYIFLLRQIVRRKTRDLKALNKTLEEYAFTDSLTGLLNRRGLERKFESKQVRKLMKHQQLALLMIDLDYFKKINDKLGHLKGDEVLVSLGKAFKHTLTEGVAIARLGGEEFCLLLEVENQRQLDVLMEYIHRRLIPSASQHEVGLHVTASIGALLIDTQKTDCSLDILMHHADQLMYRAKEGGRNRVVTQALSSKAAQPKPLCVAS